MSLHAPTTVAHTTTDESGGGAPERPDVLVLTLLYLRDHERIGEQSVLAGVETGLEARLSRVEGHFGRPGGPAAPLDDPRISRSPLRFQGVPGGVRLQFDAARISVAVDGVAATSGVLLSRTQLRQGVVLDLNRRATLHLRQRQPPAPARAAGFIGCSPELDALQADIAAIAGSARTVLVRGPTGTGKELVARAVHARSGRAGAFVGVNVATLQDGTAMGALFGHVRGAFTGATAARRGWFREADQGTLFLDEVGELPIPLQAALLRVLDDGVVVPVGGTAVASGARIVAATDAPLEDMVADGRVRAPLLHRLSVCTLWTTPLARRKEDIPVLFAHFARAESGGAALPAWFDRALVGRLLQHDWPGNVRELRNAAVEAVLFGRADRVGLPPAGAAPTGTPPVPPQDAAPVDPRRTRAPLDDARIAQVMRAHAWQVAASARALGIARNTLAARIEQSPRLRRAKDLGAPEIEAALAATGSVPAAAMQLEVSARALKARMRALGLEG